MSFKNHNNYWRTSVQSDPDPVPQITVVSVLTGVQDTYITNEDPNYNNNQVFDSGLQDFQTISEQFAPQNEILLSPQNDRQAFIRKKILVSRANAGDPEIAIGTEVTEIAIGTEVTTNTACDDARKRTDEILKRAQEDLFNCVLQNLDDPAYSGERDYLECREQCKIDLKKDLNEWKANCPLDPYTPSEVFPERGPCRDGDPSYAPPWNWYGASPECQTSYCEIIKKYVKCIGGEDICRYNPCSSPSGISLDPYGGDSLDPSPILPHYTYTKCWEKHGEDADPTGRGGHGQEYTFPQNEMAGSACWRAYYQTFAAARCEEDLICSRSSGSSGNPFGANELTGEPCCYPLLWETSTYCESLGCVAGYNEPNGGNHVVWGGCPLPELILCLTEKNNNYNRFKECLINLANQICSNRDDTNDEDRLNECIRSWLSKFSFLQSYQAYRTCRELAVAVYDYEMQIAQTDNDRFLAEQKFIASMKECKRQYELWRNLWVNPTLPLPVQSSTDILNMNINTSSQ